MLGSSIHNKIYFYEIYNNILTAYRQVSRLKLDFSNLEYIIKISVSNTFTINNIIYFLFFILTILIYLSKFVEIKKTR